MALSGDVGLESALPQISNVEEDISRYFDGTFLVSGLLWGAECSDFGGQLKKRTHWALGM